MIVRHPTGRKDEIAELERLLGDATHPKVRERIGSELGRIRSGVVGEREAAFHIDHLFSHEPAVFVVHDVRMEHIGQVSQIDHLVLDYRQRRILVVETKHYGADLSWNDHGEWTASYPNRRRFEIPSPVEQARRHCRTIERWLADRGETCIRQVLPLVMVAVKTRMRHDSRTEGGTDVVKADMFARWYERLPAAPGSRLLDTIFDRFDEGDAHALALAIAKSHRPLATDWAARVADWSPQPKPAPKPAVVADRPMPSPRLRVEEVPAVPLLRTHMKRTAEAKPDGKPIKSTTVSVSAGEILVDRYADDTRGIRSTSPATKDALVAACRGTSAKWHFGSRRWLMDLPTCRAVILAMGGSDQVQSPIRRATIQVPGTIKTRHGSLKLVQVSDGLVALRPDRGNEALSEIVAAACRGVGRWQPMYHNWIVPQTQLDSIAAAIV